MANRGLHSTVLPPLAVVLITWLTGSIAEVMESSLTGNQIPFQCPKAIVCAKISRHVSITKVEATIQSRTCTLISAKGTLIGDLEKYFNEDCFSKTNNADTLKIPEKTITELALEAKCISNTQSPTKLTVSFDCVSSEKPSTQAVPLSSFTIQLPKPSTVPTVSINTEMLTKKSSLTEASSSEATPVMTTGLGILFTTTRTYVTSTETHATKSLVLNVTGADETYPTHQIFQTATWFIQPTETSSSSKNWTGSVNTFQTKQKDWWSFFTTELGIVVIVSTVFLLSVGIAGLKLLRHRRSQKEAARLVAADAHLKNDAPIKLTNLESASDTSGGQRKMPAERPALANHYESVGAVRRASAAPPHPTVSARDGSFADLSTYRMLPPLLPTSPLSPLPLDGRQLSAESWRRASNFDGYQVNPMAFTFRDDSSSHYALPVDASDMLRPLAERGSESGDPRRF